ncbi:tail terminator [Arthrobacter phage MaGuCo]|uniref:Tail terminator n=1 Tax=Arthrobacter phage MaGuCo TaxID=3038363 RepID=A0AAF0K0N7_9CAUD|nr:tail terminator [Arthrobacter phage MaGuCo]
MRPVIVFPDPQLAVRDLIRSLLAGRSDADAGSAKVSTRSPDGDDARPVLPYVQVRSDGRYRDARLDGRATVRVTVWHKDEGLGDRLASLIEGLLLASSSADVRGCSPLVGPIPTGDPDTGAPMSYFTITARLRPRQIT